MKHLIIYNEGAGKYNKAIEEKIKSAFDGLDYEVHAIGEIDSSTKFLRSYFKNHKEGIVRVYACGGDGTVHNIVNGLIGVKNVELAINAIGTGNDFVKVYGSEEDFSDLKTLINGDVVAADVSKLSSKSLEEDVYSLNVINFGFDAIVGARGNYYKENGYPEKAKAKGMSAYDYALKNDAMKYGRFNDIEVVADGIKLNEKELLLCTLAQGQYVGGKFHCAPKSVNTDGLIDVCVLKTMTFLGLGMIIGTYTKGKHLDKPRKKVVYKQAKKIEMFGPKDFDVCVDGEMYKGNNFTVECIPNAIKLVIPKK